jgi:hypothetical protein
VAEVARFQEERGLIGREPALLRQPFLARLCPECAHLGGLGVATRARVRRRDRRDGKAVGVFIRREQAERFLESVQANE